MILRLLTQLLLLLSLLTNPLCYSLDYPDLYDSVTWDPSRIKARLFNSDPLQSLRKFKVPKFRSKDIEEDRLIPFYPIESINEDYDESLSSGDMIDRSFNSERRSIIVPSGDRTTNKAVSGGFKSWHELRDEINKNKKSNPPQTEAPSNSNQHRKREKTSWSHFSSNPTPGTFSSFPRMNFTHLGDFMEDHEKNMESIQNNFVHNSQDIVVHDNNEGEFSNTDYGHEWEEEEGIPQEFEGQGWIKEEEEPRHYWNHFDNRFESEKVSRTPTTTTNAPQTTTVPKTKIPVRKWASSPRPKRHFGYKIYHNNRDTTSSINTTVTSAPYIPLKKPEPTLVYGLRNAFINSKTPVFKVLPQVRQTTNDEGFVRPNYATFVTARSPYRNNFGLKTVTKSPYRSYSPFGTRQTLRFQTSPTTTIRTTTETTTTRTTTTTTSTTTRTTTWRPIVHNYDSTRTYPYSNNINHNWESHNTQFKRQSTPPPNEIVVFRSQPIENNRQRLVPSRPSHIPAPIPSQQTRNKVSFNHIVPTYPSVLNNGAPIPSQPTRNEVSFNHIVPNYPQVSNIAASIPSQSTRNEVSFNRVVSTYPPVPNIAAPSTLQYIPLLKNSEQEFRGQTNTIPLVNSQASGIFREHPRDTSAQLSQYNPLQNAFEHLPFLKDEQVVHFTTRTILLPTTTTTARTTSTFTTTSTTSTTTTTIPPFSQSGWLVQPHFDTIDTFTAPLLLNEGGIQVVQGPEPVRRPPRKISDNYITPLLRNTQYPSRVLEVLNDNGLTVFASLLQKFNIIQTFSLDEVTSTFFAPTNAAFGDINMESLGEFQLMKILKSHIVQGTITEKMIANDRTATSLVNTTLRTNIFKTDDRNWKEIEVKTVNGIVINKFNIPIPSSNGIIHIVDHVLTPPSDKNVLQILQDDPGQRFTTFLKALNVIKFDQVLGQSEGPWTIFAPTNKAFRTLDPRSMDTILRDSKKLSRLIYGHIIEKTVYSVGVKQHEMLSMSNGHNLNIFSRGDRMKFEGGNVIQMDISGTNGVVQVVDQVVRKI